MNKKNEQHKGYEIDLSSPNPYQKYLNICFLKVYWVLQQYSFTGRIVGSGLEINDKTRFIKCYPYLADISGFYCTNQSQEEALRTELLIFNLN